MTLNTLNARMTLIILKSRPKRLILMSGVEELLVGIETHGLRDDTVLHGLHVSRTLCDDHDVGPVLALHRLPESSRRQQLVVDDQTMVVDEHDVDARLHITVLEGIVEQDTSKKSYS